MFPISSGTENSKINFNGAPFVKSFIILKLYNKVRIFRKMVNKKPAEIPAGFLLATTRLS